MSCLPLGITKVEAQLVNTKFSAALRTSAAHSPLTWSEDATVTRLPPGAAGLPLPGLKLRLVDAADAKHIPKTVRWINVKPGRHGTGPSGLGLDNFPALASLRALHVERLYDPSRDRFPCHKFPGLVCLSLTTDDGLLRGGDFAALQNLQRLSLHRRGFSYPALKAGRGALFLTR